MGGNIRTYLRHYLIVSCTIH